MNRDFPKRWRDGKYIHTGKHDYDDGCTVGNNHSKKRTMRRFKKHKRQLLDEYFTESDMEI